MLFLAMAAAGMLTACTSNDDLGGEVNNPALSQQKIQLGVATNASVQTRGTGTVGGVNADENVWDGQYLWVYMLNKGSMKVAQYVDPDKNETPIFDNKLFVAPEASQEGDRVQSGLAYAEDNTVAYYPVSGNSDFWGYRVDNAANTDPKVQPAVRLLNDNGDEVSEEEATRRVVDFTIDGSQDVMAGKATLAAGDVEKLGNRKDDFYSAYASRHGVQPNIAFDHQLTRFTFHVKAGSLGAAGNGDNTEAVNVTNVKLGSWTNGHLTVAYTGEKPESLVSFDKDGQMTKLELQQRKADATQKEILEKLSPLALEWDADNNEAKVLSIGEALLVSPGEVTYPLTLDLEQNIVVKDDRNGNKETNLLKLQQNVNLPEVEGGYKAGCSYDVTITIYGLEKIEVTATLNPWVNGGNITIDDDTITEFYPNK